MIVNVIIVELVAAGRYRVTVKGNVDKSCQNKLCSDREEVIEFLTEVVKGDEERK